MADIPAPPYSSGNWMPIRPSSPSRGSRSIGNSCASSQAITCGRMALSANSRTLRRSSSCSSVRRKSMALRNLPQARGVDPRAALIVDRHPEPAGVVLEVVVVDPEEQTATRPHLDRPLVGADEEVVVRVDTDLPDERRSRAAGDRPVGVGRGVALAGGIVPPVGSPADPSLGREIE